MSDDSENGLGGWSDNGDGDEILSGLVSSGDDAFTPALPSVTERRSITELDFMGLYFRVDEASTRENFEENTARIQTESSTFMLPVPREYWWSIRELRKKVRDTKDFMAFAARHGEIHASNEVGQFSAEVLLEMPQSEGFSIEHEKVTYRARLENFDKDLFYVCFRRSKAQKDDPSSLPSLDKVKGLTSADRVFLSAIGHIGYVRRDEGSAAVDGEGSGGGGLILIGGGTGAGKTTLGYAVLREHSRLYPGLTLMFEDPIENPIHGPDAQCPDKSFFYQKWVQTVEDWHRSEKTTLRFQPYRVFMGEAIDEVVACAAVSLALTGHIVYLTVHGTDQTDMLTGLIQKTAKRWGNEQARYAVASALLASIHMSRDREKQTYAVTILNPGSKISAIRSAIKSGGPDFNNLHKAAEQQGPVRNGRAGQKSPNTPGRPAAQSSGGAPSPAASSGPARQSRPPQQAPRQALAQPVKKKKGGFLSWF